MWGIFLIHNAYRADSSTASSSSNDPVLHFILFVPSAKRRPLDILKDDGK
jgi:phosphatidylinositol glycan class S